MKFYFSTTGIRGKAPKELSVEFSVQLGKAISGYLYSKSECPNVVVGHDSRLSSDQIALALCSSLLEEGVHVEYIIDPIPTPGVIYYTTLKSFTAGIIVTGSHLPATDNGIILVFSDGSYFRGYLDLPRIEQHELFIKTGVMSFQKEIAQEYFKRLVTIQNNLGISNLKIHVLVDAVHGPMRLPLYNLVSSIASQTDVINFNDDPLISGRNSEPRPSTLGKTIEKLKETQADIAIATDYDGDRVIYCTPENGVISGDVIGALFAQYFLQFEKAQKLVVPINSSILIKKVAKENSAELTYSKVGAPKIIQKMIELDAEFGYEETGKYFFNKLNLWPDAAVSTLYLFKILQTHKKSLSELISIFPRIYQSKNKLYSLRSAKEKLMAKIKSDLPKFLASLNVKIDEIDINELDGIRIDFMDDSWVLFRQSGTEESFRIFVESFREDKTDEITTLALKFVSEKIREITE